MRYLVNLTSLAIGAAVLSAATSSAAGNPATVDDRCSAERISGLKGSAQSLLLADGTLVATAKVNINIDGYAKAYHPQNASAGALIHLCNAGEVILPTGRYQGSADNTTCTGRFMTDIGRIGAAGWKDPGIGMVRWYGILGTGEGRMTVKGLAGEKTISVRGIKPVKQRDGSGFFVSPTSFADASVSDPADQSRYVNPLRIPAAVIPNQSELSSRGVTMGSFGVAYDKISKRSVPFVVGDFGPAIGEATPALARSLAGQPITDNITRANRFVGQVDTARITWVFFGRSGGSVRYNSKNEQALVTRAATAFATWGGPERLKACFK